MEIFVSRRHYRNVKDTSKHAAALNIRLASLTGRGGNKVEKAKRQLLIRTHNETVPIIAVRVKSVVS